MWPDWIDSSIRISDIVLLGGGLWAFIRTYFAQQSFNKDVLRTLGIKAPPDGILGDIEALKVITTGHHETLIKLRARQGWRTRADDRPDRPGDDS